MKNVNTQLWVQNLNDIYQQALTAQPIKPFFLLVYEYVDYVQTTDTLAQLSNIFWVHEKADYEAVEEYKKELIAYIQGITPNIDKIQSDHGEIKGEVQHIRGILEGRTQVLGDREGWETIFSDLEHIANVAVREETSAKEILPMLGIEKWADSHILKWQGYETYEKYRIAKEQAERLQETRGWYAWKHLKLFYEIYKDYEGMKVDVAKSNNVWNLSNIMQLIEELKAIRKNVITDQIVVFRHEKYLPFLQKAHRQLLSEIANFENAAQEMEQEVAQVITTQTVPYIFNEQDATVEINGKTIKFQKDRRKFELFKRLIANPQGIYHAEVAEELEGEKGIEDPKTTYYETCRGIQISFLKTGITDFLDFDYNKASINPTYKRQEKTD